MRKIGLCGQSGSGKGTVASLFSAYGVPSLDTDAIYHDLTAHPGVCVSEIASVFGDGVLNADGSLSRPALAGLVFSRSPQLLPMLNTIAHKQIRREVLALCDRFEAEGKRAVLIDAPLLFESGFDALCDTVIGVVAAPSLRLVRIMARDHITEEMALSRMKTQLPEEELRRRCDFIIENNGSVDNLRPQVEKIIKIIDTGE